MIPLDLTASSLAAAIHARSPEPLKPVWVHVEHLRRWCVLRDAGPASPTVTLCLLELPAGAHHVRTTRAHNTCSACETELAARTPGAALAVDPEPERIETLSSRAKTADLRPAAQRDVESLAGPDDSAFDHLADQRDAEWEDA